MPPNVASQIDAFAGIYQGSLELTTPPTPFTDETIDPQFRLQLERQGNRAVLTADTDVLGSGCNSKIGPLESLQVGGAWDAVAVFRFDPGKCGQYVAGREVTFYVDRSGRALFSILQQVGKRLGRSYVGDSEIEADLHKL